MERAHGEGVFQFGLHSVIQDVLSKRSSGSRSIVEVPHPMQIELETAVCLQQVDAGEPLGQLGLGQTTARGQ